jgi:NhaP-type Na+/H+ and K+/H+ antiporter
MEGLDGISQHQSYSTAHDLSCNRRHNTTHIPSMFQLFGVAILFGILCGSVLAYLMHMNSLGRRGVHYWLVWAGSMLGIYALAHGLGFAVRLPGVGSLTAFAGAALLLLSFGCAYLAMNQRLKRPNS